MIAVNIRAITQPLSGVQRYALEVSTRLKNIDNSIVFYSPKNILHFKLAKDLKVNSFGLFKGHLWEQVELVYRLKKRKSPLLLNFCNTAPLFYDNQIVTIHDLAFLRHPEWFSKAFSRFYKFLIPRIAKKAKHIVTVSKFSKEEIVELLKIKPEKILVAYSAVSEIFSDSKKYRKSRKKYILTVGSIDPRKNLLRIIQAFHQIKNKEYKLLIVGSKRRVFSHAGQISKLSDKNILYVGYVSDKKLVDLYTHASLFVYPSLYEGFGLPPLEAMACGCPVIVSNMPSLKETCGKAAYYIDPYNVEDLAQAIDSLIEDKTLSAKLVNEGYSNIKRFSWDKTAEQIYTLAKEL